MKKGFALIYALLLTTILLTVLSGVAIALVSGIKLNRASKNAVQVYSLARSGIGAVWAEYQSSSVKEPEIPASACDSDPMFTAYYYKDTTLKYESEPVRQSLLSTWIGSRNAIAKSMGIYAYSACGKAAKNIFAIGYFGGQKISLKAKITEENPIPTKVTYTVSVCQDPAIDPTCALPKVPSEPRYCVTHDYQPNMSGLLDCSTFSGEPGYLEDSTKTKYDHQKDTIKIFQTNL